VLSRCDDGVGDSSTGGDRIDGRVGGQLLNGRRQRRLGAARGQRRHDLLGRRGDAIRRVRPWAVDASSRLESEPGIKDPEKVRAYVTAARA